MIINVKEMSSLKTCVTVLTIESTMVSLKSLKNSSDRVVAQAQIICWAAFFSSRQHKLEYFKE